MEPREQRMTTLTAEDNDEALARHIIDFDPRQAEHYLFAAAPSSPEAQALTATLQPDPIPVAQWSGTYASNDYSYAS
jgi:hypothetical protein